jgi:uncharacterized protein (TIGR04255 family)
MTAQTLPKKLKKEPLVDVVFEIRFSSSTAASSVLPGFFFAKSKPTKWRIEPLPMAQIPDQLRNADSNLRYQPLMRIHWDDFLILIGDNSVGVGCKMPYLGWIKFKEQIVKVVALLIETTIVETIERYSLKYIDVIEGGNLTEQIQRINMDIRVGSHTVQRESFTVRLDIPHDRFINVVQIVASVVANMADGQARQGTMVDTDTICTYQTSDLIKFKEDLPNFLDAIHIENKKMFFECLKPETISFLEPVYE